MLRDKTIPQTAEEKQSTFRSENFPFRFPSSPRVQKGSLSLKESRLRLKRFYYTHLALMNNLAAWIIAIPEFEVKIEFGHHVYYHAEAAKWIFNRLKETKLPKVEQEAGSDNEILQLETELLYAPSPEAFLGGVYLSVIPHLIRAEKRYLKNLDSLADLPGLRIIKRVLQDLEEMEEWGRLASKAYLDGGKDKEEFLNWVTHIDELISAIGGIDGTQKRGKQINLLQDTTLPYKRPVKCERDERFTTFKNTRDYKSAGNFINSLKTDYERERFELTWVQRDEIDAIETFAKVLFELREAPFDLKFDLARFIWDESRHAEIGQNHLAELGYDPFDIPCSIIGINVRSPLKPIEAFGQICIFGEQNIIGPMYQLSKKAFKQGDVRTGVNFDFIHADELMHVRQGRSWLKQLHENHDLNALKEEILILARQRLVEEGVVNEDYACNLTASEISDLIGGE